MKNKDYGLEMKYTQAKVIEDVGILQHDMELVTINLVKFYEI